MFKHIEIDEDLWADYVTVCHCWKVDPMENLISHLSVIAEEKRRIVEHLKSIARKEERENGNLT